MEIISKTDKIIKVISFIYKEKENKKEYYKEKKVEE